jgi:N-ethylmaleimide reductase
MTKDEIRQTVADFGRAAQNAMEAGFDAVQIQANYLYLIAQFLNSGTNHRTDEYGGSTVNRARFLFEIVETVLEYAEPGRVGIKIGPMNIPPSTPGYRPGASTKDGPVKISGPFAANPDTLPDMEYVIKRLNDYNLAHLLLMGATSDFTGSPLEHLAGDGMFQHFRPLFHGHLIANVEMTQERGNRLIEAGLADSIAYGRPYIANPDLPERFLVGAALNELHWPTVYASGPKGYTDYPAMTVPAREGFPP